MTMPVTKRILLEKDGQKATVTSFVLFAYVKQGTNKQRRVRASINVYDKATKVGTITIDASPPHNGYNCLHTYPNSALTATHCYLTINELTGIAELSELYAIYGISANT
jgi:hypothetical protein